jgi:serine/threonine protein kinase
VLPVRVKISESRNISAGLRDLLMKMLDKNPKSRATINDLRGNAWLNEGCKTSLIEEESSFMSEVTEHDIKMALTPIHTIVLAVSPFISWPIKVLSV